MTRNYHEILKNAGIRPSIQRIAIYAWLCENPVHPDIETVYNQLFPIYPTLSKTTVYNTLKLFEENHIAQSLKIEDDKVRFDAEMKDHIHFKCNSCGTIYDIFEKDAVNTSYNACKELLPKNFVASKMQSYIWGTCNSCAK